MEADATREILLRELMEYIAVMGFSPELGEILSANLATLNALDQMAAFLYRVEPRTEELITEKMRAISGTV